MRLRPAPRERAPRIGRALALALPLALAASVAHAEPTAADRETARGLMDRGDELAAKHDLAGALAAFQAAHALMGVPTTGLEVARAHVALGHLVEARDVALVVARLPVQKGEREAQAKARADAGTLAASLAPRIPSLELAVEGPAADAALEVTVDGVAVPPAAARLARKLDPGKHVVVVAAEGFDAKRIEVDLPEGRAAREVVRLERGGARPVAPAPLAPVATPAPAPATPAPASGGWPAAAWVGFGVGAAGLAVGAVAGGLSLAKASSLKDACDADKRCPPGAQADLDAGKTLAIVSDVGFGVAIAGAAVGVIAIVVSGKRADKAASAMSVAPTVGPSGAGLVGTWRAF